MKTTGVPYRLAFSLCAALIWIANSGPVLAGTLVPKDANHLVMQEVVISDLAQLGTLVGEDPQNKIPWAGFITDSGFSVSINAPYRDGLLSLKYTGTFDPVADQVSWTGVTTFTNAVGTLTWDSSGTYSDATKDGPWAWFKNVVKTVAEAAANIEILTVGLQFVTAIGSAGSLAAPALMVSGVVSTVTEAAVVVNSAIEIVNVIQDATGSTTGTTTRQGAAPPASFISPGLIQPQPSYIEVLSKSLMTGNYQQAVVYVNGTTSVNGTLCLNAGFPASADTFVSGAPGEQNNNYGMQEFIAAGFADEGYPTIRTRGAGQLSDLSKVAFLRFDIPNLAALQAHPPNSANLALTLHSFEGGGTGQFHGLSLHGVLDAWIEGNGFGGPVALRPPGATDPARAFGLNATSPVTFDTTVASSASFTQGSARAGTVVNFNMDRFVGPWSLSPSANFGVVLTDTNPNGAIRFGAREGKRYNIPGAVAGPSLTLSWFDKGDFNGDGKIDTHDVNAVLGHLGPVTSQNQLYDLDGDGKVTVLDGRKLARCCSRPNCATQ